MAYARIAATRFGADHTTYSVGPKECFAAVPAMVRAFDEPFGNSSAIPTYFCARVAAERGMTTLLAGDGGDELFGGNERYAVESLFTPYEHIPGWFRTGLIEPVVNHLPSGSRLVQRARGYIRRANMRGVERMLSFQFLATHRPDEVFAPSFIEALGDYSPFSLPSRHYRRAVARDHVDRLLYVDMKITLADNDLPKVTFMSELAGVQTRFPFSTAM